MRPRRELLRLAQRVHAAYQERLCRCDQDQQSDWQRLTMRYDQVQHLHRLAEIAQTRGWYFAARQQQEQLAAALLACNEAASELREQWLEAPITLPRFDDLLAELHHLHAEFDDVIVDATKKSITVQTKAIVLKEIELGRFLIRLHWPRLAEHSDIDCFEIVALDPRPAENDHTVTHPHVKNRHLCAGDAMIPLEKALSQGRLVDAFCLLRSVLETYNAGSAYVALEDWGGISCWNCGDVASEDDRYICECCDHDVCSECTSSCKECDRVYCSSCQTRCDECNEACCNRCLKTSDCSELRCCAECLKTCAVCEAEVAPSELAEETGRCASCQEKAIAQETDAEENAPAALTPTS